MIPKKIHYCWIGPAPKPESVIYCINSWKKYCPDYEIIEWNESNYDFTKNLYMKQAYEAKKWGFVPDYARLDIVFEHGGIYLDTDVEMIKPFDELLNQDVFLGFEETGVGDYFVNCGQGFGAEQGNDIIKAARDLYDGLKFVDEQGNLNMLASPYYTTQTLRQYGLIQNNKLQKIPGGRVYSTEVLCPKNFTTGKLKVTENTVSIHHFTASWLDEKIKIELAHQNKVKNFFGERCGQRILYIESVAQKYSSISNIGKLPSSIIKKLKQGIISGIEAAPYYKGLFDAKVGRNGNEDAVILDTSLSSDNLGDQIIMENCINQLTSVQDVGKYKHVPTHVFPTAEEMNSLTKSKIKFLCGTNAISGHMRRYGLWKLTANIKPYKNTVLMGVGSESDDLSYDHYTKGMLKEILSPNYIHSVRDSQTERLLHQMGITNVINTGCPTMWSISQELCSSIPHAKAQNVVCTITDYSRADEDKAMLDILLSNYAKVYLWLQGEKDYEYLEDLDYVNKVILINPSLEEYDNVLKMKDLDYVGTRLHAGIRALSFGHRTIVIAIDNRATNISNDTGLPIVQRCDINAYLENRITAKFETKITMNVDNIYKWKQQFVERG